MNFNEITKYFKLIQSEPSFKGVFLRSLDRILYASLTGETGELLTVCKETFTAVPVVIYTKKNFYLVTAFNDFLDILKQSGIIDFWRSKNYDKRKMKIIGPKQPKVITFYQIISALEVLMLGYLISIVIFFIEIKFSSLFRE